MANQLFLGLLFISGLFTVFQLPAQNHSSVIIDQEGVMRWKETREEIHGFGVNYTVPFAHAYRAAEKLGVSPEEAIDQDVYHFARLGFDAYRVHVWDTEISDSVGNLLENDHLRLFDHLLSRLKERSIKSILTPIAFWGNGYPEPAEDTPGFSAKYGKEDCLTNEDAIKAQENYLYQFLNHVNPNTGIAYKDDPDIIAFEISNEPHHDQSKKHVTAYINRLVRAIRKTGCKKPVFYNMSHSIYLVDAYLDASVQGGTFQWYPTGLGSQEELGGNLLPNVDKYSIPFANNPAFEKIAKMVYEFDAADVGRTYIYPAIARSFRKAGIQWATHFAYDPTFMAFANTEYNTHYMNLAYAPGKALSLKLAGEVFHRIPMYTDYGSYPQDTVFGPFRVSYTKDLAEMNTTHSFIYTNHTTSQPVKVASLQEIAGRGNSPVVGYEGTGAYFLDKLDSGVWRLEVMPDAIWVKDPFGRNSLERKVAVINWRKWPMTLSLPDLGTGFTIIAINKGNKFSASATGNRFEIEPGTYLIRRKGNTIPISPQDAWKNIRINEYSAPEGNLQKTRVVHHAPQEVSAGKSLTLQATIASKMPPESVKIYIFNGWRPQIVEMHKTAGYTYSATIPGNILQAGFFRYFITVIDHNGEAATFPGGKNVRPDEWDFGKQQPYLTRVLPPGSSLYLFNAAMDFDLLSMPWNPGVKLQPGANPSVAEMQITLQDNNRETGLEPDPVYPIRYYFGDMIGERKQALPEMQRIVVRGRSLSEMPAKIQVSLIDKNGEAFGTMIELGTETGDCSAALKLLKPVQLVTLPRPYPTFLPFYFADQRQGKIQLATVESLQLSIPEDREKNTGVAIESIYLE